MAHSAPPLAPPRRDIGLHCDIVALACADGCVRFTSHADPERKQPSILLLELRLAPDDEPAEMQQVQWSPDYMELLAVASDSNIYRCEVTAGGISSSVRVEVSAELWSSCHLGAITGVATLAGGVRFASTGVDGTVRVWDVERRELMERVLIGSRQTVLAVRPHRSRTPLRSRCSAP